MTLVLYKRAYYIAVMSDQLGFLLSDVSRLIRRRFDERARLIGATRAQWKTLFVLSRNEGLNQGALAERLEVEPITLGRMIDRLEEAGLVERRRDPADRRAWRIHLTPAAHPVVERLRAFADEMFDAVFADLSPDTRDQLTQALEAVRERLLEDPDQQDAANG